MIFPVRMLFYCNSLVASCECCLFGVVAPCDQALSILCGHSATQTITNDFCHLNVYTPDLVVFMLPNVHSNIGESEENGKYIVNPLFALFLCAGCKSLFLHGY